MVPNSLGPAELLLAYGTEDQKNYYLPRLADGREIPCFALTGPEAGSDAGNIPDSGVICKGQFQGQTVLGIKLNWDKRYITLAPVATVLGIAVKLTDPESLLGHEKSLGITVLLLPVNTPGIEIGLRHFPLNQPFMNGPTRGKDVFVPLDCIIGGEKQIGKGWRMLVESLSAGRGISLPALSTATGKLCYRVSGAYASIRKQFNTSIAHFEGVEAALSKIAGCTYLLEATRLLTLTAIDQNLHPSIASAITKYHLTELARITMSQAMDIHAGKAIMLGPKNYLGRAYESIPISITVEGANILTRNLMIFGQGAIRCHPFIQDEIKAANLTDSVEALNAFDEILSKHIRYTVSNFARVFVHALTGGIFKNYDRQLTRMSAALALTSDLAMLCLGGKLKRKERLSARLGDVFSYLYMASAVLKYDQDFGDQTADKYYVQWCIQTLLFKTQEALIDFCNNFPIRFLGCFLKVWIFPLGRSYPLPSDKLEHHLSEAMLSPNIFRERLTQHCYLGEDGAIQALESTFALFIEVQPLLHKLDKAFKEGSLEKHVDKAMLQLAVEQQILTSSEAEWVSRYEKARLEVISVDEFSHDQLHGNGV
jgi:alkylation response protein AidB-like acyl-CoA dehydrogenase